MRSAPLESLLSPKPPCRVLTVEDVLGICQAYRSGTPIRVVSQTYRISDRRIKSILVHQGVLVRDRHDLHKAFLTAVQKSRIVEMYSGGLPVIQIGIILDLCDATILRYLKTQNIRIKSTKEHTTRILTADEQSTVMDMHEVGNTPCDIYAKTGIAPHIVKRFLRDRNVKMPVYAYSRILKEDVQQIVKMYKEQIPIHHIKRQFNIADETLHKILKDNDITRRAMGDIVETPISPEEELQVCHLYIEYGVSLTDLCPIFRTAMPRLRDILIKYGVKIRDSGDYPKERLNRNPARGYSGYYKGHWFRSRDELSYLISELEDKSRKWETAEEARFRIPYVDHDGRSRFYFPDYFVDDKYLVEIKPDRFWNDVTVRLKTAAAQLFCLGRGWEFLLIDHPYRLDVLKREYAFGHIQFTLKKSKYFARFMRQLSV